MTEPITDHAEQAVLSLAAPFWGKPRIAAIVHSHAIQIQEIEDCANAIIASKMLDNATGEQLAAIGRIVGQPNLGWTDEIYKLYVRARIRANRSLGERSDTWAILQLLVPDGAGGALARVATLYPAAVRVDLDGVSEPVAEVVASMLSDALQAGVAVHVVSGAPLASVFTYGAASDLSLGRAWGQDNDPLVGSPWAFVVKR